MPTYTLPRTGLTPLRFSGDLLTEVSTHNGRPSDFQRWYELAIYQTDSGRYVLQVDYYTSYEQNGDVQSATVCDTPEAVRNNLAEYDPLARFLGHPHGDQFAERQERLKKRLQLDWDNAVRDLLTTAADHFAETTT